MLPPFLLFQALTAAELSGCSDGVIDLRSLVVGSYIG